MLSYPEAQLPLTVPPLLIHSLYVKQVPFRNALKIVKINNFHSLIQLKNYVTFQIVIG
jgi:hypothetical protein